MCLIRKEFLDILCLKRAILKVAPKNPPSKENVKSSRSETLEAPALARALSIV